MCVNYKNSYLVTKQPIFIVHYLNCHHEINWIWGISIFDVNRPYVAIINPYIHITTILYGFIKCMCTKNAWAWMWHNIDLHLHIYAMYSVLVNIQYWSLCYMSGLSAIVFDSHWVVIGLNRVYDCWLWSSNPSPLLVNMRGGQFTSAARLKSSSSPYLYTFTLWDVVAGR